MSLTLTNEQIVDLLKYCADYDATDNLVFLNEYDGLRIGILCNDIFAWGLADLELVSSSDDIELLKRSIKDCSYKDNDPTMLAGDGLILFCARKRGMRPQGAVYEKILDKRLYPLFDEIGEKREPGVGNPVDREQLEN